MPRRTTARKIALGFAIACLLCMAASLAASVYFIVNMGTQHVFSASAMATSFFFASCTIVLYFMSQPPRYELQPWDDGEKS